MAFESGSSLNVVYDNKVVGNIIDPTEWNNNFNEIEDKDNANIAKINANFAKLSAITGSAEIGSPAITCLGESADSNVYAQLLLATTAILDRYTKAQIDGYRTSDADKYIANITLNAQKDLVITWGDNDQQTIVLDLEKIPATFGFDQTGTKLVITNQDGSKYEADITSLINMYTFNDSPTIDFTATGYNITATVNAGSITDTMLHSDLIVQLQGYVTSASASALTATNAKTSAENARDIAITAKTDAQIARDNAQTYANNASASATTATTKASEASTSASNASTSATNSDAFATNAKSWAIGTTGTRTGEDTNNAKYYCQQAQQIVGVDYATKTELTAETTARQTTDTNLANEITARQTTDTNLANEITARQNADAEMLKKDGSVQMTGVLKTVGGTDTTQQVDFGDNGIYNTSNDTNKTISMVTNAYYNGTVWKRKKDGKASLLNLCSEGSTLTYYTAITGLANSEITWVRDNVLTEKTGLPLTGGTLSGVLEILASYPLVQITDSDTGAKTQVIQDAYCAYLMNLKSETEYTYLTISPYSSTLFNQISFRKYGVGDYKIYGEHNITVSTAAPTGTLAEGCQHQVY